MQKTKLPISTLATKAGLAATTLSRFMRDHDSAGGLSAQTIEALCRTYHVAPPGVSGFQEDDARPWADDDPRSAVRLLAAKQNADIWRVANSALEYEGYRPGDFLIVDLTLKPQRGDVVVAQRYDWTNDRAETILRMYEPPFLLAAIGGDAGRKPIFMEEGGNVQIKGVVVASYRLPRNAA